MFLKLVLGAFYFFPQFGTYENIFVFYNSFYIFADLL